MTSRAGHVAVRADLAAGLVVQGFALRIVFVAVATALCIARVPAGFWLVVALAGVALAVIVPRSLAAWAVIAGLGIEQLLSRPVSAGAELALLVAGVHLLHVLAAPMLVIPGRAMVQASVFRRLLRRFAAIQVPVQCVALVALVFSPGDDAVVPVLGVLGAVAVVALALVLSAPLLRERAEN